MPASFSADFEEFWRAYPLRVGKLAAAKAYDKVRQGGTTQAQLLDGIAQYRRTKPLYADWCHPRTFLTQGRWLDEVTPSPGGRVECQHEPRCPDSWSHGQLVTAEAADDPALLAAVRRLIDRKRAVREQS
jgi:hypothetical protein